MVDILERSNTDLESQKQLLVFVSEQERALSCSKKHSALKQTFQKFGRYLSCMYYAPTRSQVQYGLFILGVLVLTSGLVHGAYAQDSLEINFNDDRINQSVNALLTYMEGSFGALVMVTAGIGAILSSAFGQYKAALGCLVVAVGSFILRSFLGTFFNDAGVMQ